MNTSPTPNDIQRQIDTKDVHSSRETEKAKEQYFQCLSLIANENFATLRHSLEHNALSFKPNLLSASQLSDFCIYTKENWFLQLDVTRKQAAFKEAYVTLIFVKLLKPGDELDFFLDRIDSIKEDVKQFVDDPFWEFCWTKISQLGEILKICNKFSIALTKQKVDFVFTESNIPKILSVVLEIWHNVSLEILAELECHGFQDCVEMFACFALMMRIFHLIIDDNLNPKRDEFREELMQEFQALYDLVNADQLRTEVVENIFAMLFLRKSHLCKEVESDYFMCDSFKVKLILHLIPKLNEDIINALWKFELLEEMKDIAPDQVMKYMLASPSSLVRMCLKRHQFAKAHEVIKRFKLVQVYSSVVCFEVLHEIREHFTKLPTQDVETPCSLVRMDDISEISKELISNKLTQYENLDANIDIVTSKEEFDKSYLNVLDLLLLYGTSKEDCEYIIDIVEKNRHGFLNGAMVDYLRKICQTYVQLGFKYHSNLAKFIVSDSSFDLDTCKFEEKMYNSLGAACSAFLNELNNKDPLPLSRNNNLLFRLLLKANSAAGDKTLGPVNKPEYLLRLFCYLKAFSKICTIAESVTHTAHKRAVPFSELLVTNRVELLGRLLLQVSFSSSKFEQLFEVMNLDYLYHVVGNIFPTVNLHTNEEISKAELYPENILYVPDENTIMDIMKRNWFLALILDEMYKIAGIGNNINIDRIKIFLNYMNLPKIQYYKEYFFEDNISAVLCDNINLKELTEIFGGDGDYREALSNSKFCARESIEKSTHTIAILKLLQYMPERQLSHSSELRKLKDAILSKIIAAEPVKCCHYIRGIEGRNLRMAMILDNYEALPVKLALNVIKSEVSRYDVVWDDDFKRLMECLQKNECYEMIASMVFSKSCHDTYDYCQFEPDAVLDSLLENNEVSLLIKFLKFHQPTKYSAINEDYLIRILNAFDASVVHPQVSKLFDSLPEEHVLAVGNRLLKKHRNIVDLQFICDHLMKIGDDRRMKTIKLSLTMLQTLSRVEQGKLLCLMEKPLYIVESLLMNTKLDKLPQMLRVFKDNCSEVEHEMYVTEVDDLLRTYAEKSLLFPRVDSVYDALSHTLIISLDSDDSSSCSSEGKFMSPVRVPRKEEWVVDQKIRVCMCCKQVSFSMFNRRHHCRRCGRMICYSCCTKMKVSPQYGDVQVRVCKECRAQSRRGPGLSTEEMENQSLRSFYQETWDLTGDDEQNRIIREEFSYENVPSVSLCLSIMSYHTENEQYAKFLLGQCNNMLSMLKTNDEIAQEIDVFLVLRMIKALATTITLSSKDSAHSEADKILHKMETLELLAEKGCIKLLPISNLMMENFLHATSLTNLRDVLLEKEQWHLALEVSTKLRLDRTDVFTAWGKSCLNAGKLYDAREKFKVSLSKKATSELPSSSVDSFKKPPRSIFKRSSSDKLVVSGSPPLHFDIVQPLERKSPKVSAVLGDIIDILERKMKDPCEHIVPPNSAESALSILNKLKSIKPITSGKYFADMESGVMDNGGSTSSNPIYYSECVYYIKTYGTPSDLLKFFIRQGEMANAMHYLKDNHLGSEYYIEVYMNCLENGEIISLLTAMSQIDSSFKTWKVHVKKICHYLQEAGYLYSLYQLQKYMGDCIRAAMTCIRFYEDDITDYADLVSRVHFLHKGLKHLNDALDQDQWVEVSPVQSDAESPHVFEEKSPFDSTLVLKYEPEEINRHIATIQMQIKVAEYLRDCEAQGQEMEKILKLIHPQADRKIKMPTLFGTSEEKVRLCALIIVSGGDLQDGYKKVVNIVANFKFKPAAILYKAGRVLAEQKNFSKIVELVKLIQSEAAGPFTADVCDKMLLNVVKIIMNSSCSDTSSNTSDTTVANLEDIIKYIVDKEVKLSAYIEAGQLKAAYFLAVKYKRLSDVRRILHAAETLNQPPIKSMCQKILASSSSNN